MEQKILAIAGAKQAGKNTLANWLHGKQMMDNGIVSNFFITEGGELIVEGLNVFDGEKEDKKTVKLDVCQNSDYKFALWASDVMWPFVKNYSFAEALKEIAIDLFECPRKLVYGNDDDKNTVMEHLLWENMPGIITKETFERESGNILCDWFPEDNEWGNHDMQDSLSRIGLQYHESGPMTVRQFLQFLGTDVMRRMYGPIWVNRCLKDLLTENCEIAVISDCRFDNEIEAVTEKGGKVIGLTRRPFSEDGHASEGMFDLGKCSDVIDNENMTIEESCMALFKLLVEWGWLKKKEVKQTR